uniref:Uncharacterized protein n=1 Tax=Anguilla anguilla TaxID=7936 RepID=A0A0E9RHA4_ANGAN
MLFLRLQSNSLKNLILLNLRVARVLFFSYATHSS